MALPRSLEQEKGTAGYSVTGWGQIDLSEQTPELMWPLNVAVYDRMRRQDSQCIAVRRAIGLPIIGAAWRLDPNGARDEVVRFVAENLGLRILGDTDSPEPPRKRDRFSWLEHVRAALLSLDYGHMPFEQVYRIVGGQAWLRKLAPRMPATLAEIVVDDSGGLRGIKQSMSNGRAQLIGVDRLVMYTNEREGGAWTGLSIYRGAYKHWLLKDRLMRVGAIVVERNGMGVPFFEAPPGSIDADLTVLDQLAQRWRAGETSGGSVPHGTKIHLKGVDGSLPDALPQIKWHSEEIAKSALAMFLNLGTTDTGARALGEEFVDYFQLAVDAVSQTIADTATEHVVEDLVDLNFGEDEPAPRVVVAPTEASTDAKPEQLVALAAAKLLTPDAGLEAYLRDRYRLPALPANAPTILPLSTPVAAARARHSRRAATVQAADDPAEPDRPDPETLPEPLGTIYRRRHQLEQDMDAALVEPLTAFADTVDVDPVLALLGQVTAETQPVEPDPRIAAAEALMLEALTAAGAGPAGQDLLDLAHDALSRGWAEGQASAAQLLRLLDGQVGVDLEAFTVAFDDALAAAGRLDELWTATDTWFADHVGATSRMVADKVADALENGTSRTVLLREIRELLQDAKKAAILYDHAMALSLSEGAKSLYTDEGLDAVDVLTAGDTRVDEPCLALEDDSPWPMPDAPTLPLHIGCRCALAPADDAIRTLLNA